MRKANRIEYMDNSQEIVPSCDNFHLRSLSHDQGNRIRLADMQTADIRKEWEGAAPGWARWETIVATEPFLGPEAGIFFNQN